MKNNYFLVVLSASITGLSQHSLSLGFLAWFGLVPLLYVILNQNSYKSIFKFSFLWGFIYNLIVLFWIAMNVGTILPIAIISMLCAVLIMSFNSILTCLIWYRIQNIFPHLRLIIFPVIWTSVEFIRSYGILGFPWISLANSQIDYLYLIQNAEITGIYGITFWVVMINISIYQILFENKDRLLAIYTVIIFIFPWFFGYFLYLKTNLPESNTSLSVTIIQPNINLTNKRDFKVKDIILDGLIEESSSSIENGSKLIIWPESAVPFHHLQFASQRQHIVNEILSDNDAHLLTGNIIRETADTYNSGILFNKDGVKDIYHKRQPVPLAEYVPLSSTFDYLKELNIGSANFSKGEEDKVFKVDGIGFTSMICFESTFPEINRRHVQKGADALVYLVNDGWYETEPEPTQHARQAIYRAIENRRPVIRCANTGISMIINEKGDVLEQLPLNSKGKLNTTIVKTNHKTFYTRFGNVFALILLLISSVFFIMTFKKNEKN